MDVHPPRQGFSKGQWQGLGVFTALIVVLIVLLLLDFGRPATGLARVMDVILGGALAVLVVWVVGGTFEFEQKFVDGGIKAGGGAAIAIFVAVYWQPIYGSASVIAYPISFTLPQGATLGFVLDEIEDERRRNETDLIVDLQHQENELRLFRPKPADRSLEFVGMDWIGILRSIEQGSPCLFLQVAEETATLSLDMSRVEEWASDGTADQLVCK